MDDVKVSLGSRVMRLEVVRQWPNKSRRGVLWCICRLYSVTRNFLPGSCFLSDRPPVLNVYDT